MGRKLGRKKKWKGNNKKKKGMRLGRLGRLGRFGMLGRLGRLGKLGRLGRLGKERRKWVEISNFSKIGEYWWAKYENIDEWNMRI